MPYGMGRMMGWGGTMFGGIGMLIFLGIAIVLVIWLARGFLGSSASKSTLPSSTALDILKERYAKGEFSKEEYEEHKKTLIGWTTILPPAAHLRVRANVHGIGQSLWYASKWVHHRATGFAKVFVSIRLGKGWPLKKTSWRLLWHLEAVIWSGRSFEKSRPCWHVEKCRKRQKVFLHASDEFFGEECVDGQGIRIATAATTTDSNIVRMKREAVRELIHSEPGFAQRFIAHILHRSWPAPRNAPVYGESSFWLWSETIFWTAGR
jgi:putative membrane protein